MSSVRLTDLLSNGDNKSSIEIIDALTKNEESHSEMSFVQNSNALSLTLSKNQIGTSDGHKPRLDIDVDYAIELLKKEDQNINVYSHLQEIINKILLEKPKNPLKSFEFYSQILKRSYIPRENYFEPVYVDHINRDDCRKNLEMYECALKVQSEKQKRYDKNNTNTKNKDILNSEDKNTINGNDFEVHVQNLWDANYMFNKAGCGLPIDEVALISLTMNTMARSNEFKNIRFWGKIFGMRKTYFILECEWTDVELHRKILKRKNNLESSSVHGKEELNNVVTHNYDTKQIDRFKSDVPSKKNKNETESKESSQPESLTPTIITMNTDATDESIVPNDLSISMYESDSGQTKLESSSPKISDEMFGTDLNKKVYFVSTDLNTKFIELDSVRSQHIAEARKIKRYFTGKLYEPISSFPKFNGLEIDYLRAQIARISASTQICPHGYCGIDEKKMTSTEKLGNQPSTKLNKTIHEDLVQNKNFKPIPNNHLVHTNNWKHKNPRIQNSGIANDFEFPVPRQSTINEEFTEEEEYSNSTENSLNDNEELFESLKNDISFDATPAWKGSLCSPFNPRNSCTMMKSHVWPGACAVAYKLETDYVYIGWAQKNDYIGYGSNLIGSLRLRMSANENYLEYQEQTEGRKMPNLKKNINRKYRRTFKGSEKLIRNYTYDFN